MNSQQDVLDLCRPQIDVINQIVGKTLTPRVGIKGRFMHTGYNVSLTLQDSISLSDEDTASWYARWNLTQFPGNCGIIINHEMFVRMAYRNKRIGVALMKMVDIVAQTDRYTLLVATTVSQNTHADKLLNKFGYDVSISEKEYAHPCAPPLASRLGRFPDPIVGEIKFTNRRTGRPITTWWKHIQVN
jgi:hypothetical protein